MAPSNSVLGMIAASAIALGLPHVLPADAAGADWPCVQRKVATLTSAQMWDGAPVDDLTQWRDDEQITKLIAVLASHRSWYRVELGVAPTSLKGLEVRFRGRLVRGGGASR